MARLASNTAPFAAHGEAVAKPMAGDEVLRPDEAGNEGGCGVVL